MKLSSFVPSFVSTIASNATNFSRPEGNYANACIFLSKTQCVAVAAAICFAAYQGSMIAAGVLATVSVPATTLAAGAMAVKYGYTALKAGIAAKQLSQAALGAAALYAGWKAFDEPDMIAQHTTYGLFDGGGTYTISNLSKAIATKLGYTTQK